MLRPARSALTTAAALVAIACGAGTRTAPRPASDPGPQTIDEFKRAASAVLEETRVPGAGIALVRQDGVDWVGGLGYADRDARTPVTADTHFRVGSISKTFVAMALVQLSEDGLLDLDATLEEVVPEVAVDNPWQATDPVRVIHVLQHTAGFDDMRFTDRYVAEGDSEGSLMEALARNPGSRRVRWRPGTRMAYSNVGYGIAGVVLEKVTGEPYEDYIKRQIFDPLGMSTSSFRLTAADEALLARGYDSPDGPPVGFPRIYLRPAGNLHSSARELASFIRMLLGWGELGDGYVIDPEYLGNMEQPRTTLASTAGLHNGYGTGIITRLHLPFRVLGHDGGIDGFWSSYAYSPSRDVGFVVLVNSTGERAPEAVNRISSLAIRYLKRDVEPPPKPAVVVDPSTLDRYTGYYHDANPRNQMMWPLQWLLAGRTIVRDGEHLVATPIVGARSRLIPVSDTAFRLESELDASRVFTNDSDGRMVLAGVNIFAERRPRWDIEIVRVPLVAAVSIVASVLLVTIVWAIRLRRARPRGFWMLKLALLLCPIPFLATALAFQTTPGRNMATPNVATIAIFLSTLAVPLLGIAVPIITLGASREGASRWLTLYAMLVAAAMLGISIYLATFGMLGLQVWKY